VAALNSRNPVLQWVQGSHMRIFWIIVFVWTAALRIAIFLLTTRSSPGSTPLLLMFPFTEALVAFYTTALNKGPIARLDEKWQQALSEGRAPQWTGLFRLAYVVGPWYLFGWVPQLLYDGYFHQFYNSGIVSDSPLTKISQGLNEALPKALREVWTVKNARDEFDLNLCSEALYDMTVSLMDADLHEEANTVTKESQKVLSRVQDQGEGSDVDSVFCVLKTLVVTHNIDEAVKIAKEPQRFIGIAMTDKEKARLVRIIIGGLAEDLKDFPRAIKMIPEVEDNEERIYTIGDVCQALAQAGRQEQALELVQKITDESPDFLRSFYLLRVCEILSKAGWVLETRRVAKMINEEAYSSRKSAMFYAAEGFATTGKVDEAKATLEEALAIPHEEHDWALFRAVLIIAEMDQIEEALAKAEGLRGGTYYIMAMKGICEIIAKKGQTTRAVTIASEFLEETEEVMSAVAKAVAETGNIEEAQEIADSLGDDQERGEALSAVSAVLAKRGKVNEAIELLARLPEEHRFAFKTCDAIVEVLGNERRIEEAIDFIGQAYEGSLQVEAFGKLYATIKKQENLSKSQKAVQGTE